MKGSDSVPRPPSIRPVFVTGGSTAGVTALVAVVMLAAVGVSAACASSPPAAQGGPLRPPVTGTVVSVELTDAGCTADRLTAPAGTVSFQVTSTNTSGSVTELEVLRGTRILAERENIASGLTADFSVDLSPGSYTLSCPGGTGPDSQPFTTTAAASTPTTPTP